MTRRPRLGTVVASDGVHLAVVDYNPPAAEHTVVFLHGLCLNRSAWAPQIGYLLRRFDDRLRIIAYDHRGHGTSECGPTDSYHVDRLGGDLADILAALNVTGQLTLVGHSMGGMAALAYLARDPADRPVDPHGLVLVATAAGNLTERGLGRLLHTPAVAALCGLIGGTPQFAVKALGGPLCAALARWYGCDHAQRCTLAALAARAVATTPASTIAGFLLSLCDYNQYAALASVRARTIVVSGGGDLLTPVAHSEDLVAGIHAAEHIHLPGVGHMLLQEAPTVVNDAIRTVLSGDSCHDAPAPDVDRELLSC